jgi:hypothetical protein
VEQLCGEEAVTQVSIYAIKTASTKIIKTGSVFLQWYQLPEAVCKGVKGGVGARADYCMLYRYVRERS